MKEYLMLIRNNAENENEMSAEEMQKSIEAHTNWVAQLMEKGHFKGGNPLMPHGKCIKGSSAIVTDGPFIELKESISGYYFLLANSLEEATEISKGCPSLKMDEATLEVREVIDVEKP
ncbi:YciI family protein [Fulvivirga lutea]|uniref:YCII-related domain-containing protein n=1 Tax=Fulvivirga lutea TaxID=2810512 RepID=A0A974WK18_9BACT|nr:YciI family protein [Fulvivirga lutea]QSE99233.1 hypothetical protein JR347_09135 [Fulvivirga lutea]